MANMIKHPALTLTATLAAAALVMLAGCEKNEASDQEATDKDMVKQPAPEKAPDQTDEPDKTTEAGATRPQATPPPTIKLLDPGAEPRRQLRYKLVKDSKESLVMAMNTTIQTKGSNMPGGAVKIPTMTMDMDLRVIELLGNGEARYEFELTGTEVKGGDGSMPQLVEMTRMALEKAKGMRGTAVVNSRGFNRDATMELPPTLDPQMRITMENTMQSMDQMSSPLPEEAVGKGAKWELHQQIEQNGMKVEQVTVFELVELDGDKGKLAASVTQKAGKQKLDAAKMMGGSAELLELASKGSGTIEFDLNHLVPTSTMSIVSDYSVKIDAMGQTQTMNAHLDMNIDIRQR